MIVRPLTAADVAPFKRLRLDGIARFPEAFLLTLAEAEAADMDRLAKWLDGGGCYGLYADADMVGFAGMARRPWTSARHRADVGPFYVIPEHQGQGGAQVLMDRIASDAAAMGVLQLELWVWSGNPRAVAFYTRNGFAKMGVMPRAVIVDGQERDDFFMVRHLDR